MTVTERHVIKKRSKLKRDNIAKELLVYFVILSIAMFSLSLVSLKRASNDDMQSAYVQKIKVEPGDTLWKIAEMYAPEGYDLRNYVTAVMELNDLEKAQIYAGEKIVVPVPPKIFSKKIQKNSPQLTRNKKTITSSKWSKITLDKANSQL